MGNRKQQVLQLLADGYNRQEIAQQMFVSVETVKSHLKEIRYEFNARTTVQAVASALRRGVIQ